MSNSNLSALPASKTVGTSPAERANLERQFDSAWYAATYARHLREMSEPNEHPFAFYIRLGAKLGHDPNAEFSEIFYRTRNADIRASILCGTLPFGFAHWLRAGRTESSREAPTPQMVETLRATLANLDFDYIRNESCGLIDGYISPADFYFENVRQLRMSPSQLFSEAFYVSRHPDVAEGIATGEVISGYSHYLIAGRDEQRAVLSVAAHRALQEKKAKERESCRNREALETSLPGVTHPIGLDAMRAIEFFTSDFPLRPDPRKEAPTLLVLVPNFLPEILFGGYQAFFDFLAAVRKRMDVRLELLVVSRISPEIHAGNMLRMQMKAPDILKLFEQVELFDPSRSMGIGPRTQVLSYAAELHHIASRIAACNARLPCFFVQECETDFHPSGDMQSFVHASMKLPHSAIYNSSKLREFFEKSEGHSDIASAAEAFSVIENPLRRLGETELARLAERPQDNRRSLIFYARPEAHAARNHFATFVHGLKLAVRKGVFSSHDWSFHGLGSLGLEDEIDLGSGLQLVLRPKMEKAEYEEFLLGADIGVSFISTPHPGIVHFQMANYGLTTLTNVTAFRDQSWLTEQNPNIVGTELDLVGVLKGLQRCVTLCEDRTMRIRNASLGAVRSQQDCIRDAVDFIVKEFIR